MSTVATPTVREFTEYPNFTVEYMPNSHRYAIIQGEDRVAAVSVTSSLKVLDKPALVGWAEKCGVEGALRLERAGELQGVPVEEAVHLVRMHKQGADAKRDAGADRGTAVHEALRLYCSEGTIPKVRDFPLEVRGYVQGLCGWLLSASPAPIDEERIVGSVKHGFAGRYDLLADIDGQCVLVDLKTSPRIYAEHHLQVAAYILAHDECFSEGPKPDSGLIVTVGEDGTFQTSECCASAHQYLAVLACHGALQAVRSSVRKGES